MPTPVIVADIRGRVIARDEVVAWEDSRITAVARKLGAHVPSGNVAMRRDALLRAKLDLGPGEIASRLHRETRVAEFVARAGGGVSRRRRLSAIDLSVDGGTGEQFVDSFERWRETSDEAAMLRACPDHFVIRTRDDGGQEVLERTGGSPLPSLFFIDWPHHPIRSFPTRSPVWPGLPTGQRSAVFAISSATPIPGFTLD